jgi:hypothetical protein
MSGAQASPAPEEASVIQGTYTKIPRNYPDKGTSGLSVTLKRGKNEHDVPLTD